MIDLFDALIAAIILAAALALLVGYVFHFAYSLGEAAGALTERVRWQAIMARVERIGRDEREEWPEELP